MTDKVAETPHALFLRGKSMNNTELYVRLAQTIFGESSNDDFIVKVVDDNKPEEGKALLEVGFDPVCQTDNHIFLRKHK